MDEKKLSLLKKTGLTTVLMGLQTGSEKINRKIYNRPITNKTFLKAAKLAGKYNLNCIYDVILDNPYETEEDIIKTINILLELPKPFQLNIHSLWIYQGTALYNKALEDKIPIGIPHKKNMYKYKQNYFSKLVRLCPLLPGPLIRLFLNNRKSIFFRLLLYTCYYPVLLLLEPVSWFRQTYISFDNDLIKTFDAILSFPVYAVNRAIFRKLGY